MNSAWLRAVINGALGLTAVLAIQQGVGVLSAERPPAARFVPRAELAARRRPQPGRGRGMQFTEPSPLDFNDHEGYVSIFDGRTLDGWDGNPKFWRVEDGAIVGESTPERPSGNSYIAYRRMEAKDFTLKFEIKVEGTRRQRTAVPQPHRSPVAREHFAERDRLQRARQSELDDDGTASRLLAEPRLTGQFYSENTPMRILAWRGQVVEGFGDKSKRLMATIGDRQALGDVVKQNDWNQYTVIARGGTFLHILNGQLMSVMIDDDPSLVEQLVGSVRDRNRGDDQGIGAQYLGEETELMTSSGVRYPATHANVWTHSLEALKLCSVGS